MRVYWLIEPEMSASTTSGGWTSRGERNFGRISSPPVRAEERIMARGSMMRPRASGRKRRVVTVSKGSRSASISRRALPISSALICAKSLARRTSLPDTVKRASTSISGISSGGLLWLWPSNMAWLTRFSAARGFCRLARGGRDRREHGDHLLDQLARLPEQPEGLVEDLVILVAGDEHGMERPVEVVAAADAGGEHRLDCIAYRGRPDPQPRLAQRSGEIDDVVGDAAVIRRDGNHRRASRGAITAPPRDPP